MKKEKKKKEEYLKNIGEIYSPNLELTFSKA